MTDDDQGGSVPPAPCPGTPEEWRAYLAEYSDWALRSMDEGEQTCSTAASRTYARA